MRFDRILFVSCSLLAMTAAVRGETPAATPDLANAMVLKSVDAAVPAVPAPSDQPAPFALPAPAAPAAAAAISPPGGDDKIDLSALYFFASQNNLARVSAEIRLIRLKHPTWQPPEDLFQAGSAIDEQPLWDLYAKHDLAGIHDKMDAIKRDHPDWRPSNDLSGKLALAEAHDALVKASDAKQWSDVIAVASNSRMLLTCGDLDAIWRTAEALAQSGDQARALDVYRYVLVTCDGQPERLATVQKAGLLLTAPDAIDKLVEMGRKLPNGRSEFDDIRFDRFRRKIGAAIVDEAAPAPTDAELAPVIGNAKTSNGRADAELLGWYFYTRRAFPDAQRWFKTALALQTDGKTAEGLVLSMREAGDVQARAAALQYAGLDEANRRLMADVVTTSLTDPAAVPLTSDEMATFEKAVDELKVQDGAEALRWLADHKKDKVTAKLWSDKWAAWRGEEMEAQKSLDGAEGLGWTLFQNGDIAGAETWFQKSMAWRPNESAAIGLTLAARRLNHAKDFASRVAQFRGTYPAIAKLAASPRPRIEQRRMVSHMLARRPSGSRPVVAAGGGWDKSADQILNLYKDGRYGDTVSLLEQRRAKTREPHGLSVIRGWAMFHQGDWEGAKRVFGSLDNGQYSKERSEGLRVIDMMYSNPRYR